MKVPDLFKIEKTEILVCENCGHRDISYCWKEDYTGHNCGCCPSCNSRAFRIYNPRKSITEDE